MPQNKPLANEALRGKENMINDPNRPDPAEILQYGRIRYIIKNDPEWKNLTAENPIPHTLSNVVHVHSPISTSYEGLASRPRIDKENQLFREGVAWTHQQGALV